MIDVLIYSIVVSALLQPTASRLFAAAVFAVAVLTHEVAFSGLDGLAYYASAAVFDLGVVVAIGSMSEVTRLAVLLQRVCLVSILLNAAGWLMWVTYLPPTAYNTSFTAIYAWAVYILLTEGGDYVGGTAMGSGLARVCFDHSSRAFGNYKHGG